MTSTRRYLLALDESENCEWAFNYTSSEMNKHLDELHLITVRNPDPTCDLVLKERELEKKRRKKLLRCYAERAHRVGV